MARCLVVAHQTAESPELLQCLRELASSDPNLEFTLLVPATPVCNAFVCDEIETARAARESATSAEQRLRQAGLNVTRCQVGDADPIEAIRDELVWDAVYDVAVISTLPPGVSRWLKRDVLSLAARLLPDTRVISVI